MKKKTTKYKRYYIELRAVEQGDRVVILGNEEHGYVTKVRLDSLNEYLIDIKLDDEDFTRAYHGMWVARPFELREEGEDEMNAYLVKFSLCVNARDSDHAIEIAEKELAHSIEYGQENGAEYDAEVQEIKA